MKMAQPKRVGIGGGEAEVAPETKGGREARGPAYEITCFSSKKKFPTSSGKRSGRSDHPVRGSIGLTIQSMVICHVSLELTAYSTASRRTVEGGEGFPPPHSPYATVMVFTSLTWFPPLW